MSSRASAMIGRRCVPSGLIVTISPPEAYAIRPFRPGAVAAAEGCMSSSAPRHAMVEPIVALDDLIP
jgi:hypothetical protein